nr:MAG TPA: hemolysin [Caudoviricetes sp.]
MELMDSHRGKDWLSFSLEGSKYMSEHDFQTEVLERMSRLETQSKQALDTVKKLEEQFQATKELAIIADQRGRSAHHRINSMYVIAGIIGGVISFIVDYFRH